MKIALGADHDGFELKEIIRQHLANRGFEIDDAYLEEAKRRLGSTNLRRETNVH